MQKKKTMKSRHLIFTFRNILVQRMVANKYESIFVTLVRLICSECCLKLQFSSIHQKFSNLDQ